VTDLRRAGEKYTARASQRSPVYSLPKTVLYWATWGLVDPSPDAKIAIHARDTNKRVKTIHYRDQPSARDSVLSAIAEDLSTHTVSEFEARWINRDVEPGVTFGEAVTMFTASATRLLRRGRP
jgi:hypothetical protein